MTTRARSLGNPGQDFIGSDWLLQIRAVEGCPIPRLLWVHQAGATHILVMPQRSRDQAPDLCW
jgi:hypothetical protein